MEHVLIAGASGLVGQELTRQLQEKGYRVFSLSHSLPTDRDLNRFHWNPIKGFIEEGCLDEIDHVVNLAGVGVYDSAWSQAYKTKILVSRVSSTALLGDQVRKSVRVKTFVNASAIGVYGSDTKDQWVYENSIHGEDFLATVVKQWEDAFFSADLGNVRRVALRLGVVLSLRGGALPQLIKPINYYVGAPLASGKQYMSWIHIDDVCAQFIWAIEEKASVGIYNAVASEPVTNTELTKALAVHLKKPLFLPNVPAFMLKMMLGQEKAETLIGGNRVNGDKIVQEGFRFKYKTLNEALHSFFRTN